MNRKTPPTCLAILRTVCLFLVSLVPAGVFAAVPPAPSQPVASCAATVNGKCYVNGSFTLTTYSPGASHYHVCRSEDTTGWGGCQQTIATYVGPSYTVSGADVPSDGSSRAYYFRACDAANNCTLWSANDEAYVHMDATGPGAAGPTTTTCKYQSGTDCWVTGSFTISATPATDGGSGVNPNNYGICRSHDSPGGHAGCNVTITSSGGTSLTVSGSHLPSDGFRRAYRFRARDWLGNLGAWNNPLYVRVDRYNPTVSADNASSDWFSSRTATITAADATVSAVANSGLKKVRYRWNTPLNGACTDGTATSDGAVVSAPAGENWLYLCAKDNTGRGGSWNGGPYRTAPPAVGSFQDFGYIGMFHVTRQNGVPVVTSYGGHVTAGHGIHATIADVPTYEDCTSGTDHLAPADAAATLAASGFKLMLNLQWVLFERTTAPCDPHGSSRLRSDWNQRLTTYAQHAGGHFNYSNTAYMVIHSEVANSPSITPEQMIEVSVRAKELFPGIPAAAGYPTGTGGLPTDFPWPLDIIFTWNYNIADPNDSSYVNGDFTQVLNRLSGGQTVGVLVESFGGDAIGISGESLALLARRWCEFAQKRPEVEHVVGFHWNGGSGGGAHDIIHSQSPADAANYNLSVESAHRAVARAALNQGGGSCWAPE